jgi:hypothetical protein
LPLAYTLNGPDMLARFVAVGWLKVNIPSVHSSTSTHFLALAGVSNQGDEKLHDFDFSGNAHVFAILARRQLVLFMMGA